MFDELDDDLFIARNTSSRSPMMSSTMISSVSSMFQNPAEQTQKLTAMEDELTILRQQIAMLVEAQEQINKSQCNPFQNSNLCLDLFPIHTTHSIPEL